MKRLLFIMSLLTVFLVAGTLKLQAAPIPDGFAGKPPPHRIESGSVGAYFYGYISSDGAVIVPPKLIAAWPFHDDRARVIAPETGKYGFINPCGDYIIAPNLAAAADFSEGMAAVKLTGDGLYGYINTGGELVIAPQYTAAHPFINGRARVNVDGVTAYIDKQGVELLRIPYLRVLDTKSDRIAFQTEDRKLGFMDYHGKVIVEPQYRAIIEWSILMFNEPITPVGLDKKYGFIDKNGAVVVDFIYDWVHQFREGLAVVSKDGRYGFLDNSGKIAIPLQFEDAWDFSEGLAAVKIKGRWGFIDRGGTIVIEPQFLNPRFGVPIGFHEGLAAVRTENGSGYIDREGNMVIAPVYASAGDFSGGVAEVRFPNLTYINKQGQYLWPRPSE